MLVAEGKGASLATFTPPHTFFFTREVDTNLGYVWYRKDAATTFGIGIRQADGEEVAQYVDNFALFNAPPGTVQKMGVYFYASPDSAEGTRQAVLRFTHGDEFKPLPGYKTFVNHFHLRFTDRVRASGSFDTELQDLAAMKTLGLNIIGLSDFHGDLHPNDPGPLRFKDQKDYFEATRRASDTDFLVTPWEEPSAYLRRALQHHVPEAERVLVEGAPAGTAVHRSRSGLRQGVPHRQRGRRPADDGRGRRLLVPRASPHERYDRLSGSDPRQACTSRTIGTWASRSSPAWAWICPRPGSASGGASTRPIR